MEKQRRMSRHTSFLLLIVIFAASCGVTSRYRLDLFVASEDVRKKVSVEEAEIITGSALGDPYQDYKIDPGEASVAVMTVSARWSQQETERFRLLDFDEYWRCKLYVELEEPLAAGVIDLQDKSFLQLMGRYDVSAEDKIFLPSTGSCTVDSVNSKAVFFSIEGKYANRVNEPLEFSGQFKISRPD